MGRAPCSREPEQVALRRGPWTPDEDRKLVAYIQQHGHGSWRALPKNAGTHQFFEDLYSALKFLRI